MQYVIINVIMLLLKTLFYDTFQSKMEFILSYTYVTGIEGI